MFKKLRNRFLILNLVIISIMMLISFTSIYLITYNNVHKDITQELHRVSEFNRKLNMDPKPPRPNLNNLQPPPEPSVSFTLITDNEWNILNTLSVFNLEEEFYETAKNTAIATDTRTGKVKLDGAYWVFLITPHFDGYQIVFLDVTPQQGILINLIYTFVIIALIMLIVIFFISRFFANRSIEPIKEAFNKQKQFIADASHELKTPLAVINTNVDVLLSNKEESISNHSKWLNYIKAEIERMTKLTDDLLYLTQIDYSDIKMIYTNLNLSELVENAILTMEAVFFENNILLKYDIEPNLIIHGNSEQIQQVIMILLDNSIKYTNVSGTVNISLKKHQNHILLSITNTGSGIPKEHINKIFDRFYRIDKSRARQKGSYGLGLAIAKTIVEQHDGKISAKSVLNKSTTFEVKLPCI